MSVRPLSVQIKPLIALFIYAYCPALVLLSVVVLLSSKTNVPIATFTRDVTAVVNAPFYTGALSQVGILLWCASASVCLLTAIVLHRVSYNWNTKAFICCVGLLTAVLMLDDAFQIHERIAPRYLDLSSKVLFILYGAITMAVLVTFRHLILRTDYILLGISLGFLAASVAFDTIHDYGLFSLLGVKSEGVKYLLEDGFKLLGIVGWCAYCARTCLVALVNTDRVGLTRRCTGAGQVILLFSTLFYNVVFLLSWTLGKQVREGHILFELNEMSCQPRS